MKKRTTTNLRLEVLSMNRLISFEDSILVTHGYYIKGSKFKKRVV